MEEQEGIREGINLYSAGWCEWCPTKCWKSTDRLRSNLDNHKIYFFFFFFFYRSIVPCNPRMYLRKHIWNNSHCLNWFAVLVLILLGKTKNRITSTQTQHGVYIVFLKSSIIPFRMLEENVNNVICSLSSCSLVLHRVLQRSTLHPSTRPFTNSNLIRVSDCLSHCWGSSFTTIPQLTPLQFRRPVQASLSTIQAVSTLTW